MSIVVNVNGESINYPQTGDTNWGDEATDFAVQTSSALAKVGLSTGTTVDLPGTLDVTGNTTLDANLSVAGNVAISANETVGGTLGVTGDITTSGILTASNSTNVTTAPPITFMGDTNTGIGHSSGDTLDLVTNGVSRARLNSTGQQSSVVPDLSGSNTTLYNEYKCRAWVNFNGTTASPSTIRGSGNVQSVTKNGTGDYTINFTTAMPDINYSIAICIGGTAGAFLSRDYSDLTSRTTSLFRIITTNNSTVTLDPSQVNILVFR